MMSRREILNQIDEITKQIEERHHEETRQQIDQVYEELYQRIKELRDDDAGEASPE
jgi:phage terminase Nu1 subunit (DNA packaging protein)